MTRHYMRRRFGSSKKKISTTNEHLNARRYSSSQSHQTNFNIQHLTHFAKIRGKIAVQGTKIEEKTKITYASYIDVTGRHVMHVPALV